MADDDTLRKQDRDKLDRMGEAFDKIDRLLMALGLQGLQRMTATSVAELKALEMTAHNAALVNIERNLGVLATQVQRYVDNPIALKPFGAIQIFIPAEDSRGGPAANFIVTWGGVAVTSTLVDATHLRVTAPAGASRRTRRRVSDRPSPRRLTVAYSPPRPSAPRRRSPCSRRARSCRRTFSARRRPRSSLATSPSSRSYAIRACVRPTPGRGRA